MEKPIQPINDLATAIDFKDNYESKVREAADHLKYMKPASFGITLGSGLGDLANEIDIHDVVDYGAIPHFPTTTVPGHEGKLIYGRLEGVPVIGLKGRTHYYEHADDFFNNGMLKATFAVQVLAELGVRNYFVTNAAGGLNTKYRVGDIMALDTHIHKQPNPLLGRHRTFTRVNDGERVWRFQPMHDAYDKEFTKMLIQAGSPNKIHKGTYAAVTGPTYESKGEALELKCELILPTKDIDGKYRVADAVGMSTTGEVIIAKNRGMSCVGFSCITNEIPDDGNNDTNHEEVKAILDSKEVKDKLTSTVRKFFTLYRERHMI
tara:strand:+ start:20211 stop:21170 length:960 start_codon:yes stop_codon:yes gene_type:complete